MTTEAQRKRSAAHRERWRAAGFKPVTVWLTTEAHTKLMRLAESEDKSLSRAVERLVMFGSIETDDEGYAVVRG